MTTEPPLAASGDPQSPGSEVARPADRLSLRRIWSDDGKAVVAAAAVTIAVELGVFIAGLSAGALAARSALGALAASALWVALAAPVLGASARGVVGAILRGGIIADASAVSLIVLWLAWPEMTFLAAVEIYCILAAMALAAVAAVCLARRPAARYALAVAAAAVLVLNLAGPFWMGGALGAADHQTARSRVAATVHANPFYAITAAVADQARFVWHQADVLYRITRIGDYAAPPPVCWYISPLVHLAAGGLLASAAALRHWRWRRDTEV